MNIYTPLKDREKHFIKRLNDKFPSFEYVCGYEHSDKPVLLRCKICGYEFERLAQVVRHNKKLTCFHCEEVHRDNKRVEHQIIKNLLRQQKDYLKELNKKNNEISEMMKWLKQNTYYINKCKFCNEDIYSKYRTKIICDKCSRKHKIRNHSYKPLKELYKRDKGICYLCGNKCDYEDYTYKGNTFIAGNYYPSIDHVIPISKGGTDDWNNIKLAHRICNSLKRDNMV